MMEAVGVVKFGCLVGCHMDFRSPRSHQTVDLMEVGEVGFVRSCRCRCHRLEEVGWSLVARRRAKALWEARLRD